MHEGGGRWVGSNKLVELKKKKKENVQGFPDGSVVKNLPAKAGDTSSIPGPRGYHMPQGNKPVGHPQPLSLCSLARELRLLKPACPRAGAQQQEKPQ